MSGVIGRTGENRLGLHPCVGYYERPDQQIPTYDPGWGATPCLVCWKPLGGVEGANEGGDIRTHGALSHGDAGPLSVFYRTHKSCADAHPDDIDRIEGSVVHGERGATP